MNELDTIVEALSPVAQIFRDLGVPFYVGGSVASSFHGAMRSTRDVDVIADLQSRHVPGFLQKLGDEYYASETAIRDAIRRKSCFNLIHFPTGYKVDVFANRGRVFDRTVFARSVEVEIGQETKLTVPMATSEDILLAKLAWYREGGEVSERQWEDVSILAELMGDSADMDYLKESARELAVSDLLERLWASL